MNYKANGFCSLLILVLGIVFICYDNQLINKAVLILCGVAFFVPGLLSVAGALVRKAQSQSSFSKALRIICGISGMGLGVCIWCVPEVFQPVIVYLFGALLILGGIYHLFMLSSRHRAAEYPGWLIVGPLLNIAAGVVMIVVDYFHHYGVGFERNEFWLILITAICMIIFGLTGLVMSVMVYNRYRRAKKISQVEAETDDAVKPAEEPEAKAEPSEEYQGH